MALLKSAWSALVSGDTAERDRLVDRIYEQRRSPESAISEERDKAMTEQVAQVGKEFVAALQRHCPELFAGDARSTAVATLALAETLGGILASAQMHGGPQRAEAIADLFKKRVGASFDGIGQRLSNPQ